MRRVVVSCRRSVGELSGEGASAHLERVRQVAAKAEALGGQLVAWGATTVSFAFEPDAFEEALSVALDVLARPREEAWSVGVADGEVLTREGSPRLAWGAPLVAAEALAAIARPGELVVARDLPALTGRWLTPLGARAGYDERRRVRGVAIDPREPWRASAAAAVERVVPPAFFGRERLMPLLGCPGAVAVIAADSGMGGTRALAELAAANAPAPALAVRPWGARTEPLGALRAAFARFLVDHPERIGAELLPLLDRLLAGTGVDLKTAVALVLTALRVEKGERPGALLLDDVLEIDDETLEACARAARAAGDGMHVVARTDASGELPPSFAKASRGHTLALGPFGRRDAEAFAAACVGGAMAQEAAERWARRGGLSPLGIVEAIAAGFVAGDLAWRDDRARPRRSFSGKGKPRDATEWVRERAAYLAEGQESVLLAVAVLGGTAAKATAAAVVEAAGARVPAFGETVRGLIAEHWLVPGDERWLRLVAGTHTRALLSRLDQDAAARWHAAVSAVLARDPAALALADAARHAMAARDPERAAALARMAGDVAARAELDEAASRLYAFARSAGGDVPELDVQVAVVEGGEPFVDDVPTHDLRLSAAMRAAAAALEPVHVGDPSLDASELATVPGMRLPAPATDDDTVSRGAEVAGSGPAIAEASGAAEVSPREASELARDRESGPPRSRRGRGGARGGRAGARGATPAPTGRAAVAPKGATSDAAAPGAGGGDEGGRAPVAGATERPAEALPTQRLAEILRLRAAKVESTSLAARCQASLALGVVLASVGRVEEALLEGLEALARAREDENERGLEACLAFLAKLFARAARPEEARRIGMAARRPADERLRPPY